jgi:hypothetical protein
VAVPGNSRTVQLSPMAPLATRLAEGEERTATVCLVFVIVSLILGISFVGVAVLLSPGGVAEKAIWGLIGTLMTGISLMIRGLHREATMSAYRWRGVVDAYEAPRVTKATIQKLDSIILEYLEREVGHGGRSRASRVN